MVRCCLVALVVFVAAVSLGGEEQTESVATEAQLAEALRQLDLDYKTKLKEIDRKAQALGYTGLKDDLEARRAAASRYRVKPAVPASRVVSIVATITSECEDSSRSIPAAPEAQRRRSETRRLRCRRLDDRPRRPPRR